MTTVAAFTTPMLHRDYYGDKRILKFHKSYQQLDILYEIADNINQVFGHFIQIVDVLDLG